MGRGTQRLVLDGIALSIYDYFTNLSNRSKKVSLAITDLDIIWQSFERISEEAFGSERRLKDKSVFSPLRAINEQVQYVIALITGLGPRTTSSLKDRT